MALLDGGLPPAPSDTLHRREGAADCRPQVAWLEVCVRQADSEALLREAVALLSGAQRCAVGGAPGGAGPTG